MELHLRFRTMRIRFLLRITTQALAALRTYYFDVLGAEIVQDSGSATGWKYKYGDQGDVLAEALNAGSPVKTVTYTSPSAASGQYVAYASGDIYASDTVIGTAVDRAYFQNMGRLWI